MSNYINKASPVSSPAGSPVVSPKRASNANTIGQSLKGIVQSVRRSFLDEQTSKSQ